MNGNGISKDKQNGLDHESAAMMPKNGWADDGGALMPAATSPSCGVACCRPQPIRRCGSISLFTVLIGFTNMLTMGSIKTYMNSQLIFLERQYNLPKPTSALLVSSFDMGYLVFVIFTSYFANKWNIPRVIAISTAVFGIACIICALPAQVTMKDLVPAEKVKPEDAKSLEKLLLSVPGCSLESLGGPAVMQKMMAFMKKPKGPPRKPKKKKTPPPTVKTYPPTTTTTTSTTVAPRISTANTDFSLAPDIKTQLPQTTTTTTTAVPTTLPPKPLFKDETMTMPNFTRLQTRDNYDLLRDNAATFVNLDLDEIGQMPLKEQIVFLDQQPDDVKSLLPSLKILLGPNPDWYFMTVDRFGNVIYQQPDHARVKRSATAKEQVKWVDIKQDMIWNGMTAKTMKLLKLDDATINAAFKEMCPFNTGPFHTDKESSKVVIALITVGMIIAGMASAPQTAFSTVYIDNAAEKDKIGLYLGVIYGMNNFGLALSGGIGAVALMTYFSLEDVGAMTYFNARWISAWWAGYVLYGLLALALSGLLIMFPRTLSGMRTYNNNRKTENIEVKAARSSRGGVQAFFSSLGRIFTNALFLMLALGNTGTVLGASGYISSLIKYIETQFSFGPLTVAPIIATAYVILGVAGAVIGGFVTYRLRLSPRGCLQVTVLVATLLVVVQSMGLWAGCDQPIVDKGEKRMTNETTELCSTDTCGICVDLMYSPMCGSDGKSYFSPCHAGCALAYDGAYHDCKCVEDRLKMTKPMLCEQPCNTFIAFAVFLLIGGFLIQFMFVPSFLATIRSVESKDMPMAIGVNSFLVTLLGSVPSSYIFGVMIEDTCALPRPACGPSGTCAFYDIETMRFHVQGFSTAIRAGAVLFYAVALFLATRGNSVYRVKAEEEERTEKLAMEERT